MLWNSLPKRVSLLGVYMSPREVWASTWEEDPLGVTKQTNCNWLRKYPELIILSSWKSIRAEHHMCLPCFFLSPWLLGGESQNKTPNKTKTLDWMNSCCELAWLFYLPESLNAMGQESMQCDLVSVFFSLVAEKYQVFYIVYGC